MKQTNNWHDLLNDPNDLPPEDVVVDILYQYNGTNKRIELPGMYTMDGWARVYSYMEAIAWRLPDKH